MVRNVAVVIFYDKKGNIYVQERGSASKVGEKYGFWGGQIEKGETPEQAMKRELKEELGFIPRKLDYWGKDSHRIKESKNPKYLGWLIKCHIFLSLITSELKNAIIKEGKGMLKMSIDDVIKGKGFPSGKDSTKFMEKVKKELYGKN